jgi:hypothetical protein
VYEARTLGFVSDHDREYWWTQISDTVRERIASDAGPTIEWWAYRHGVERDRAYAVVLGRRALVVTTPRRSDEGTPKQRVHPYRFVPGSLRQVPVTQRPSRVSEPPGLGLVGAASPLLAIAHDLRGFLGNLPPEAQQRMQKPFLTGDSIVDSGYFYYGSDEDLSIWCYLAGHDNVTFVSGRRVAPVGSPPHATSWDLICRHARVTTGRGASAREPARPRGEER